MSSFEDLKTALDSIGADVTSVQTGVDSLNAQIAALAAQIAASGTTLSAEAQASLDAAVSEAAGIKTKLDTLATTLTPPAPPAA